MTSKKLCLQSQHFSHSKPGFSHFTSPLSQSNGSCRPRAESIAKAFFPLRCSFFKSVYISFEYLFPLLFVHLCLWQHDQCVQLFVTQLYILFSSFLHPIHFLCSFWQRQLLCKKLGRGWRTSECCILIAVGQIAKHWLILNCGFEISPSHLIVSQRGHMWGVEFRKSLC